MMSRLRNKVSYFALSSRIIFLIASALFNLFIPDHSADAFYSPSPVRVEGFLDKLFKLLFGGLMRWDAQYFFHIYQHGYTYEPTVAFFPLFPLLVRALSWPLSFFLSDALNEYSLFMLCSVFINILCFTSSATALYDLSKFVLNSDAFAYKSAILYCINPASVFFIAPYSESLFAFLTFYGLLKCCDDQPLTLAASYRNAFVFAVITRSNGILNIGYIVYKGVKEIFIGCYLRLLLLSRPAFVIWNDLIIPFVFVSIQPYAASVFLISWAFLTFQSYIYMKFCLLKDPASLIEYRRTYLLLTGEDSEEDDDLHWCNSTLPLSYSYVQSHYWHVGLLKYYEIKQIPNFLLAVPAVYIILHGSVKFVKEHWEYVKRLGLVLNYRTYAEKKLLKNGHRELILPKDALPYVVHALFLTIFCVFYVNVQVTTRLIASSCPVFYWFALQLLEGQMDDRVAKKIESTLLYGVETVQNMCSIWKVFILTDIPLTKGGIYIQIYFLSYTFLGLVLFSNFFPWT